MSTIKTSHPHLQPSVEPGIRHPALMDLVLGTLSYGLVILDRNEKVLLWSGWLQRSSGVASSEALGRSLVDIFPELAGNRVLDAIQSALQQGFPSVLSQTLNKAPFPLYTKVSQTGEKQRIQQKINVQPLNRDGATLGCMIEIFDVSLAVRREKALSEQKKFLNSILDSEPECVMVLAPDGELLQINRAGLSMLEVASLEEARRVGFLDFVLPEHKTQVTAVINAVFAGADRQLEFEIEGQAGDRCWLDINATALRDSTGRIEALLTVGRDITARRQAEATTRALIDATHESAMLLDRKGTILAVNETAASGLGRSPDTLVGENCFSLLPPEVAADMQDKIQLVRQSGEPLHVQQSRHGAHSDTRFYPVKDSSGKVGSVAVYAEDVTERVQQLAVDSLFHEIDQQILLGRSKQGLFEYICGEVARIFDYPFVWIGRKMPGGVVSAWAHGCLEEGGDRYFEQLEILGVRWDNTPLGFGPSGSAIRTGQVRTARIGDFELAPWRDAAERLDLRAILSIPLILRGEVFGSFTLASRVENNFENAVTVRRLTDIAGRICVAQERAMDHDQLRLLQTALSTAANGVFITDRHGRIEWLNAAFVRITGYSEEETLGATTRMLQLGQGEAGFFGGMQQSIASGTAWTGESVEQRKDGTSFNVRQTITPITDTAGVTTHFISILEDVTEARAAEARIQRLAHYDYLTGLPNRALFNDRLQYALTRAKRDKKPMGLMFLDLDHFKAVNDAYGHDIGDRLLVQVAQRLQSCLRESDTLARLAGDEFTVMLPSVTTRDDIAVVAGKIVNAFVAPFDLGERLLTSGVSMGIALFPQDAAEAGELLKRADKAMYAAKHLGRKGFVFYADMADVGGPA